MSKNILVIYHANCMDGLVSAWVCAKHLSFNNKVEFSAYKYGVKVPHLIGFTDVYIVDFSFPKEEMMDLLLENPFIHFTVIDHHKTAEPLKSIMLDNFTFIFDINYCGATLAWKYFHPECAFSCTPLLLQYIEDRDLWKWQMFLSKAVNAYIRTLDLTLESIENLLNDFRDNTILRSFMQKGIDILEEEKLYIAENIKMVYYLNINGYSIPYVKVDRLASEVLEALYQQEASPFAIGWREWDDNQIKLEFRSKDFDVSTIAKQFGGGGHFAASGAQVSRESAKAMGLNI
jgi:uncharacterized protein